MAKLSLDLTEIDKLAQHLCQRVSIWPNENSKKYIDRIWDVYLKIVSRPGVAVSDEATRKKQFEKTVTSILKS